MAIYRPQTASQLIIDLVAANGISGPHTIILKANALYDFTEEYTQTNDHGASALPNIAQDMKILGQGAILRRSPEATDEFRLLNVDTGKTVTLDTLVIKGGYLNGTTDARGGGVSNHGTLTLVNCQVKDNTADYGGGIYNDTGRTLIIKNSLIQHNYGQIAGGVFSYTSSTVKVENTRFHENNLAATLGLNATGGLYIDTGSTVTIEDSSFTGNEAADGGAIRIKNSANVKILYTDFHANKANNLGGAIAIPGTTPTGMTVQIRHCRIWGNTSGASKYDVGYDNGITTGPSVDARYNWWGADSGPSGVKSGTGDSVSDDVVSDPFLVSSDCVHDGGCDCTYNYASNDCLSSGNPISLRLGEKRLDVTDISLNTPSGELAFKRSYRQDKQSDPDAQYEFMGLGWTHNFDAHLTVSGTTPSRKVTIKLPDGGKLITNEVTSNVFEVAAGSGSALAYNSGSSTYTLTAQDKRKLTFEASTGNLLSQVWPNGEVLDYTYTGTKLTKVEDDYDNWLVFSYYDASGEAWHGKLWRVGDHTSDDLDTSSPTGRFVTFTYTPQKDNGVAISGAKALLASVTDVRGETWTYTHYGQIGGESDDKLLDRMIARHSPAVDVDGDGDDEAALMLERLTYRFDREFEINGNMDIDAFWDGIPGLVPAVNEQSTGQVYEGVYSRYIEATTLKGIESAPVTLQAGLTYEFQAYVYILTGSVAMRLSTDTFQVTQMFDTNDWYVLNITYTPSTAKPNTRVQFLANSSSQFYVDKVSIKEFTSGIREIQQERGFDAPETALETNLYQFKFNNLDQTLQTTAGRDTMHYFDSGIHVGSADPAGNTNVMTPNSVFRPEQKTDANGNATQLGWAQNGRVLTHVTDALNQTTSFVYDVDNPDADLKTRLLSVTEANGRSTEYIYGDSGVPRQPTEIRVSEGDTLLRRQAFEYDAKGRTLSEKALDPTVAIIATPVVLQEVTRTYYTSGDGNGLLHVLEQQDIGGTNNSQTIYTYDKAGRVTQTTRTSNFGSCEKSVTVYDAAGNVVASICNYAVPDGQISTYEPRSIQDIIDDFDFDPEHPEQNKITIYEYDAMGRRVKTITDALAPWTQTSLTLYDALSRVIRTIQNYKVQGTSAPGVWVFEGVWKQADGGTAIVHGDENNENIISDTAYNARGLVKLQRDALGHATLYGYDQADRLVRTVQNASQPDYDNDYISDDADPELVAYPLLDTGADEDIITSQAYDAAGNRIVSTDARGMVSYMVYDALNRVVKTVQNAKDAATIMFDPDHWAYDATNDPRSDDYVASTDPDRDQINLTEYNVSGQTNRTRRLLENRGLLEQWDVTLYGYDSLGRQIKTMQHASAPEFDLVAHPDLATYSISPDLDQDMQSETVYDESGRVLKTIDVGGRETYQVYDGLGRVIRTIQNYEEQGSSIPADWVLEGGIWKQTASGTAIEHGDNHDVNQISETVYDNEGRVASTRSAAGIESATGYDANGRAIISVQNFVEADPEYASFYLWDWHSNAWYDRPTTDMITPVAVARGDNFDQNIVTGTSYDDHGRVKFTRDARGNITRQGYDNVGRRVITVTNYVPQMDASDPAKEVDPSAWRWQNDQWEFEYQAEDEEEEIEAVWHAVVFPAGNDQNLISQTTYDLLGRVSSTRDTLGRVTRFVYDAVGRRIAQVANYTAASDPATWSWNADAKHWEDDANAEILHGTAHDENLISKTTYNRAGQVVSTQDVRGTLTTMIYDKAGRSLSTTGAAGTGLDIASYTNYDKAGRVLRRIASYVPQSGVLPDTYDGTDWAFNPTSHGARNDENLIMVSVYDKASRVVEMIDALGNSVQTFYNREGQVTHTIDPMTITTAYRYDKLRRRVRVIQNYDASISSATPEAWVYESGWKQTHLGAAVGHGTDNDKNIIAIVAHDDQGRMISLINPLGNVTQYAYDTLGRRTSLTNPLDVEWLADFTEANGTISTVQTMPGLSTTTGSEYTITRKFDRLGRPVSVEYGAPTVTPDVKFAYSLAGDRVQMAEYGGAGFTSLVRQTDYDFDAAHRLINVDFNATSQSVAYAYDVQGRRTQMTVPTVGSITYGYDARGRLIQMMDWDDQITRWSYDKTGRPVVAQQDNGLRTRYQYDVGGRLTRLRHLHKQALKAQFDYTLDVRGNRTRAQEWLVSSQTPATKTYTYDDVLLEEKGTWTPANPYKTTTLWSSALKVAILGRAAVLTYGVGPDHGRFDVYVNGTLWQSFDGYAASIGDQTALLALTEEGFHTFEICNTTDKSAESSGNKLSFKMLVVTSQTYASRDVAYTYDGLSRVLAADTVGGLEELFVYDQAGNLTENNGVTRVYNEANQMTHNGAATLTYDVNGNLTNDGTNTYTWDRAGRLLGMGGLTYKYDGEGNRRSQTVTATSTITNYLLDTQPALAKVIKETTGSDTMRYLHSPMGLQAQQDSSNVWSYAGLDGLGSVRTMWNDSGAVQSSVSYSAYGTPDALTEGFAFTGEQRDANGLQYHRARYYSPALGVWVSEDLLETANRYGYVDGNVANAIDPSGFDTCFDTISQSDSYNPLMGAACPLLDPVKDAWLQEFGFCIGGMRNEAINNIIVNIEARYGVKIPQRTTYDPDIASMIFEWKWEWLGWVAQALWLISKAIDTDKINSNWPTAFATMQADDIVKSVFKDREINIGTRGNAQAEVAFVGGAIGVVPPPGVGETGRSVYLKRGGANMSAATVIHELGHILDFKLGTSYTYSDLEISNSQNKNFPSTMLYRITQGKAKGLDPLKDVIDPQIGYDDLPINAGYAIAMVNAASNSTKYNPAGLATYYKGATYKSPEDIYSHTNHYEDFAETWMTWVIDKSTAYHNFIIPTMGTERSDFMYDYLPGYIQEAMKRS